LIVLLFVVECCFLIYFWCNLGIVTLIYLDKSSQLKINSIMNHQNIKNIKTIYINGNSFSSLEPFKKFKQLKRLELRGNNILEIKDSDLVFLDKLNYLDIDNNPFVDLANLKLDKDKNHKDAIINYVLMRNDSGELVENPVKILFLGNHSSGKSTFANYFISKDTKRKFKRVKGTHILNIYNYKKDSNGFPKALIYDFGGQDYYHGIYKAFLSSDSISVLFWQGCNDKNKTRLDTNGLLTQDFSKIYWLYQLKYYNQNSSENKYEVIVTQTHAHDENEKRKTIGNATESLHVSNEFFVELSNDAFKIQSSESSLNYFENTLIELIERNQIKEKKPKWYIDFLKHIYNQDSHESVTLDSLKEVYNRDKDLSMKYLPTVLDQLHKYGKVIYFKDNDKLKDIVWLNPAKTVEYIHQNVLNKRLINRHNGIVEKETFELSVNNSKILELLIENKVIFLDETISEKPKYVIPGYLSLVKNTQENYFILSDFSNCNFILKFRNFIPFGFMNRLVCYYGKNPEVKHYWRDQIIFTSNEQKAKINVKLDFENLEIRITIKPLTKNLKISDIEQDIFADLLSFYFDLDLFHHREHYNEIKPYKNYLEYLLENYSAQLPEDMHLSIDRNWYINFKELQNKTENFTNCVAYNKELNKEKPIIRRSIDYKNFTTNKNIIKMKKIFISYSNKDYKFLEKLETHLSPFSDLEIIGTWDCTQLRTGYWHKQIQDKLKEADIVIFMLSPDFLASKYILNEELLPSFKEFRNDGNKKLMFVVVRNFAYNVLSKFSDLTGEIDLSESKNVLFELTRHQFIPYQKPKSENNNTERKLLPIKQWEDEDDAYVEVISQLYDNIK
jgi:internalin A